MSLSDVIADFDRRDWQTVDSGTVRFALIGLGWWTVDVAIPAIESSERCETTVLVSSSVDKAERIARQHDIDHGISYDDYHDGAVADAYDAVYIGTPNAYHKQYAETAAENGKAVLCEKPIESTIERAEAMVSTCEDAGIPFMTAYRMQTDPAARRARELVAQGVIGRPLYAHGTNSQPLLSMIPDKDQWRLDSELSGYGTSVMDLGIYPINTARFILDRDPIAASADMASEHEAFDDVEDQWATFTLRYDDGISLLGSTSQHAEQKSSLSITGTEGIVELSPAFHGTATLHVKRDNLSITLDNQAMDAEGEMTEEFDYFADRVLGDGTIHPDGRHGLYDLQTIRAIHEAGDHDGDVPIATD